MKIITIETQVQLIPLKTPFITALRRVENVEFVRVTVTCENGMIGIGEAPATKAITNEGIDDILKSVIKIQEYLLHQSLEESLTILHANCEIGSSAKASIDMAIVSLLAQEKGQKLYAYFGASTPSVLKTDITISLKDEQSMLEDSIQACEKGMDILKVKLGKDIAHAIRVTKKIAKALPHATLLIDANQAWDIKSSLEYIKAMQGIKVELIEQPVGADALDALKIITQNSHIPILADESVFTLEDVKKVVQTQSASMINIKLMKCGGVSKAIEILQYARKMKVTCMLGSMLEGPYSINVALHLCLEYKDVIRYIDLDSPLLYKEASDALDFTFNGASITYNLTRKIQV
ncbi:dipeptide epimerase [Sulfurimonas sp. SAG-AH-194-I05]|nr:dipeptide epimerase [Sulfurimonas sp. SAG-AH-194-I05]MDF1874943.1 dipeptide epimerase [Sulfurimonas sp. SAG-AH-194-I05]